VSSARAASASRTRSRARASSSSETAASQTQIATYEDGPITHNYAATSPTCARWRPPLPRLPLQDARGGFLQGTDSVCPGCSTGCNIFVDHRDDEVHRLRPRRNVDVNSSWMCDIGAWSTRRSPSRPGCARRRALGVDGGTSWAPATLDSALDMVQARLQQRGRAARPSWPRPRPPTRTCTCSGGWPRRWAGCSTSGSATAGEDAGARGPGAPALGPQPQHHGGPRPRDGTRRRGRHPRRLPLGQGEGAPAAGTGAAARAEAAARWRASRSSR
jgi:anaerobic selenocysteine-containing dehydrogenase